MQHGLQTKETSQFLQCTRAEPLCKGSPQILTVRVPIASAYRIKHISWYLQICFSFCTTYPRLLCIIYVFAFRSSLQNIDGTSKGRGYLKTFVGQFHSCGVAVNLNLAQYSSSQFGENPPSNEITSLLFLDPFKTKFFPPPSPHFSHHANPELCSGKFTSQGYGMRGQPRSTPFRGPCLGPPIYAWAAPSFTEA